MEDRSILMASYHSTLSDIGLIRTGKMLLLFGVGSVIMRGAGCIVNDMWDRDVDRHVERTRFRPLASGQLSLHQASALLASQLTLGLGVLLQLDDSSRLLGAAALVPVALYPLAKRLTHWPQLMLGFTFNWGAMLGWSAMTGGQCYWPVVLPLYAACIQWTLIYDTVYAHQDKKDDVKLGVKSTALRLGNATPLWLTAFSGSSVACLTLAGWMNEQGWPYYASVVGCGVYLLQQALGTRYDLRQECHRQFVKSQRVGQLLSLGLLADLVRLQVEMGF